MRDVYELPEDLPVPIDDGACDLLKGMRIPNVSLPSTSGQSINLALVSGMAIFYFYPMIGDPKSLPEDDWNLIPGARGCTPQSCAYRDNFDFFKKKGIQVLGISSQSTPSQVEAKNRLQLQFDLVSDESFDLCHALRLPTFIYKENRYIKRLTLVVLNGVIDRVIYPVFPSNSDSAKIQQWLNNLIAQQHFVSE
jgi:peroxiredoxin